MLYLSLMSTINPHLKTLLIALFVAVVSQSITPFISMAFYYIPVVIVPFSIQVSDIVAVVVAFFIEEAIRRSNHTRRTKIILACGIAAGAALAYVLFLAWVFRMF
jgi:hypothetical protein